MLFVAGLVIGAVGAGGFVCWLWECERRAAGEEWARQIRRFR